MEHWYAVLCKPGQDLRAEYNLRAQDFVVLRPLARIRKRCQGRRRTVIESLFPRYLLLRLDDTR